MKTRLIVFATLCGAFILGCNSQKKLSYIRRESLSASLSLPGESPLPVIDTSRRIIKDTITYTDMEGHEMIIMNAVKDESGDMVAHDVIDAAVVTARFRNVAERLGRVDIEFQVRVPSAMQDSRWQLRFNPQMHILEDTLDLEDIIITGSDYRKAQLRGYQQYQRFINSIITDTTLFVNAWQLELFLERNIPQLFAMKTDTSFVSDEEFRSVYGVSQQEAVEHYTNSYAKMRNSRKNSRREEMFRHYVKAPIVTDGIRLDTVLVADSGDFIYNYIQTISTRPRLRKVEVVLSGDIFRQDEHLYSIPVSEPLTFYISSLSAFVDPAERYMTKVVERRVEANTACYIDFDLGKDNIDEGLGYNAQEIGRIKGNLRDLLENEKFDIDSITISSFASPEGTVRHNSGLSLRRARSAASYFDSFVRQVRDSIRSSCGVMISVDGNGGESVLRTADGAADIRFISHSGGENWDMLCRLVREDEQLSENDKADFEGIFDAHPDPDTREELMSGCSWYRHVREKIYPRLRIVKFDFYLHRKGMVKDTVHTTVLDSAYMEGVRALQDRDYERAVTLLRPYNDYNTAVAYCSMDYNASAMAILETLEKTPQVNYMLSVLYSRQGDDESAVRYYLRSCEQEPSYIHRGNLDPEVSLLIKRYALHRQDDDNQE